MIFNISNEHALSKGSLEFRTHNNNIPSSEDPLQGEASWGTPEDSSEQPA